jgi:hypothetical protein
LDDVVAVVVVEDVDEDSQWYVPKSGLALYTNEAFCANSWSVSNFKYPSSSVNTALLPLPVLLLLLLFLLSLVLGVGIW